MQSQVSTDATDHSTHTGAVVQTLSASGAVLPSTDFIKAIGGASGIVLTLTGKIYPCASPASPVFVNTVFHAVRTDAGAGVVSFVDFNGALFNGQASWVLLNQYQWAIFVWDGVGWTVMGN
jgi:hypothetical protein